NPVGEFLNGSSLGDGDVAHDLLTLLQAFTGPLLFPFPLAADGRERALTGFLDPIIQRARDRQLALTAARFALAAGRSRLGRGRLPATAWQLILLLDHIRGRALDLGLGGYGFDARPPNDLGTDHRFGCGYRFRRRLGFGFRLRLRFHLRFWSGFLCSRRLAHSLCGRGLRRSFRLGLTFALRGFPSGLLRGLAFSLLGLATGLLFRLAPRLFLPRLFQRPQACLAFGACQPIIARELGAFPRRLGRFLGLARAINALAADLDLHGLAPSMAKALSHLPGLDCLLQLELLGPIQGQLLAVGLFVSRRHLFPSAQSVALRPVPDTSSQVRLPASCWTS